MIGVGVTKNGLSFGLVVFSVKYDHGPPFIRREYGDGVITTYSGESGSTIKIDRVHNTMDPDLESDIPNHHLEQYGQLVWKCSKYTLVGYITHLMVNVDEYTDFKLVFF